MKFFEGFCERGLFWFRICGYGIRYKNLMFFRPLLSEREGRVKVWQFGNHSFRLLTPPK